MLNPYGISDELYFSLENFVLNELIYRLAQNLSDKPRVDPDREENLVAL